MMFDIQWVSEDGKTEILMSAERTIEEMREKGPILMIGASYLGLVKQASPQTAAEIDRATLSWDGTPFAGTMAEQVAALLQRLGEGLHVVSDDDPSATPDEVRQAYMAATDDAADLRPDGPLFTMSDAGRELAALRRLIADELGDGKPHPESSTEDMLRKLLTLRSKRWNSGLTVVPQGGGVA